MKYTIISALLLACFQVFAQTNTDSKGYVTNDALLAPFTFTNKGTVISNAVLVKLTPNKFIYKTQDGGEGMLELYVLPKELQKKFGYDPKAGWDADLADYAKKEREQEAAQRSQVEITKRQQQEAVWQQVTAHKLDCTLKVTQKTTKGLLTIWGDIGGDYYFLKDVSAQQMAEIYDDQYITGSWYRVGTYTYTTVMGGSKTVQCLTCSPDVAVQYYSTNGLTH